MKIDYISDLHLDFWIKGSINGDKLNSKIEQFIESIRPAGGDMLVLAGDITHYNSQLVPLFTQLKKIYKHIIVTWGNHDLYLISTGMKNKYNYDSLNRLIEMEEICNNLNVIFLDGQTIEIDGIVFGGTGMWYDLPEASDIEDWKRIMNDSRLIMQGENEYSMPYSYGKTLIPSFDTQQFYKLEKEKLENMECDILITHLPCFKIPDQMMDPRYVGDVANKFYYAPLFELTESTGCQVHIAGHTHTSYDFQYGSINLKINPLGYPGEKTNAKIQQFEFTVS